MKGEGAQGRCVRCGNIDSKWIAAVFAFTSRGTQTIVGRGEADL
jgi:hypothetical protein